MKEDNHQSRLVDLIRQLRRLLLAWLSADWLDVVAGLWRLLGRFVRWHRQEGLYEILDYDLTLDLRDIKGKLAIFRRQQRVRFLQDHIIAYQDEAWGDGQVVAGYECHPGVPVDIFRLGARHLILISLRQTKNRGDVVDFEIERQVKDGFTRTEEWLEVETRYPTHRLRIAIVFPRQRPCSKAWLVMRRADRTLKLDQQHFTWTRSGRQMLSWTTDRPLHRESYTICWTW